MKFIYILEDDERIQKDLFETLKSIDPKLHIRLFLSLADFHEWLKIAAKEGPRSLAQGGRKYQADSTTEEIELNDAHQLRLVIAKDEFLGTQNMGLVKRARDFFLRKKMCTEQEPTALILTAFDSPDFDIGLAEERIINNVIFKPFDKLILKQHLEYALTGHQPVSSNTVATMKINSSIEMLKEVEMKDLSEVGFSTVNNHAIAVGAMTKYYNDAFKTQDKKSAYAFCKACTPIDAENFLCEFLFFAMDNDQISQIRRRILQDENHIPAELNNASRTAARIAIIDESTPAGPEVKNLLSDRFSNADVFFYNSYAQFLSDLSDKETPHRQVIPPQFDFIFAHYDLFEVEKEKRWEATLKHLADRAKAHQVSEITTPQLFMLARKKIQMDELRTLSTWTKEIFYSPIDKGYLTKKMVTLALNLNNKSPVTVSSINNPSVLKVANPVEITQISEAGLVMKYYRPISIGAFREFILWRPDEAEIPEIIGTVNFNEKAKNGDHHLNHFVFFGMTDYFLKHIRLWLLEAYIKQKEK